MFPLPFFYPSIVQHSLAEARSILFHLDSTDPLKGPSHIPTHHILLEREFIIQRIDFVDFVHSL